MKRLDERHPSSYRRLSEGVTSKPRQAATLRMKAYAKRPSPLGPKSLRRPTDREGARSKSRHSSPTPGPSTEVDRNPRIKAQVLIQSRSTSSVSTLLSSTLVPPPRALSSPPTASVRPRPSLVIPPRHEPEDVTFRGIGKLVVPSWKAAITEKLLEEYGTDVVH